jgi:hypothetical protein
VSYIARAVCRSIFSHHPIAAICFTQSRSYPEACGSLRNRHLVPLVALVLVFGVSCGKIGAPIPPARFTERTAELTAIQRGAAVVLTWPAPSLAQKESSRSYIARVDIYRLTERIDEEPVLDVDDYQQSAKAVGFLDRAMIQSQIKLLGRLQFTDAINLSQTNAVANTRLRYAIRYVNNRDQSAAFSNTVAIEPGSRVALPASGLTAIAPGQDLVTLKWTAPDANVDGTRPASIAGYNVYRRKAQREAGGELLNDEPITELSFNDTRFEYKADYIYFVRVLSQGATGLIESADSELLAFTPVDTFAPAPPNPVSIASANGTMSLFWPSSSERDVIGYNVYRAGSADAEEKDWIKLTDQPIAPVTFRDDRVVIDQTYSYRVTAIDRFNNESAPSKVVTETAHP